MDRFTYLKDVLKKLPGIGEKSAERIIYYLISDNSYAAELSLSIDELMKSITVCSICGNIDENDPCSICSSVKRENSLMIVESPRDIRIFEKSNRFLGKYHVLSGLINPLSGIMPENINLEKLSQRIESENISEVIVALSPTTEGETTSAYIISLLEDKDISISRIAFGVPFGSDFDYVDNYTLGKSLDNRNKIK